MNPIIKQQLEKCRVADIPSFDDTTTELIIEKQDGSVVSPYQVHKCYLVEIADWIIHPSPEFTLASNWNKGTSPTRPFYCVEICQVMGKMIRISGCGYDPVSQTSTPDMWEGWVPQKGLKLLKELN